MTRTTYRSKWDGIAALAWMGVIIVLLALIPGSIWSRWPEHLVLAFWEFCWWPPVLVLAFLGFWRGNTASKVCAVIAIVAAIVFAFILYGGSYST